MIKKSIFFIAVAITCMFSACTNDSLLGGEQFMVTETGFRSSCLPGLVNNTLRCAVSDEQVIDDSSDDLDSDSRSAAEDCDDKDPIMGRLLAVEVDNEQLYWICEIN